MNSMPLIRTRIIRLALFGYLSVLAMDASTLTSVATDNWTLRFVLLGLLSIAATGDSTKMNRERGGLDRSTLTSVDGNYHLALDADGSVIVFRAVDVNPLSGAQPTDHTVRRRANGIRARRFFLPVPTQLPASKEPQFIVFPKQ